MTKWIKERGLSKEYPISREKPWNYNSPSANHVREVQKKPWKNQESVMPILFQNKTDLLQSRSIWIIEIELVSHLREIIRSIRRIADMVFPELPTNKMLLFKQM